MAIFRRSRRYKPYRRASRPLLGRLVKILLVLVAAFILHQILTGFVLMSLKVESAAMEPAHLPGYRLLAAPLWYGFQLPFSERRVRIFRPSRGDLVLARPPYWEEASLLERTLTDLTRFFTGQRRSAPMERRREWENDLVVKRIIALPGDTVRIRRGEAFVRPQGTPDFVSEFSISFARYRTLPGNLPPGWEPKDPLGGDYRELHLGPGEYYLLGDNRGTSTDSRLWGPVSEEWIRARVLFRYWPLGRTDKP